MMKRFDLWIVVLFFALATGCDINNSNIQPEASFVRVYESTNPDEAYYPQDIISLSEGNYLIVSSLEDSVHSPQMNYPPVCLIGIDAAGEVISTEILPVNYSNPVPGAFLMGGAAYFVCMDDITNQAILMEVEISGGEIIFREAGELQNDFPLYVWSDGSNILLLSYNSWGQSILTKYRSDLTVQWESSLDIDEGLRGKTMEHLRLEDRAPFFISEIKAQQENGKYLVNCFDGSSLALKYFDMENGSFEVAGIYSYQAETGITAALHHRDNLFSLARFHSGNSYVYPLATIETGSLMNTAELDDIIIPQLKPETPTDILLYKHHDINYIVFGSTTRSNQILLLFYNEETGIREYTHTLGFGNPVEITKMITSEEGSLVILGETMLNEKYQRINLYKIDPEQLLFDTE